MTEINMQFRDATVYMADGKLYIEGQTRDGYRTVVADVRGGAVRVQETNERDE